MMRQIVFVENKILSDDYFILHNATYDLTRKDGEVIRHKREVYGYGNNTTILLYNTKKRTVVLIHQFRITTRVNGDESEQLTETCVRLLDGDGPEVCIHKGAIEETGYEVGEVRKSFELYMSPGGVTELVHFFIARYGGSQRINAGGGVEDEDIEVPELSFSQALEMIKIDEVRDGKTVLLLNYL